MEEKKIRNMDELATVIGISRPTLSKYFNDPTKVRSATRERIEAALDQYDYRPNMFAMNQNRRSTRNIGIVVPTIADPFFSEVVRHVEMRCTAAGYWPIVIPSHGATEQELAALDTLRTLKLAGAVIAPLGETSDVERLRQFADETPTVLFDSYLDVGQTFVGNDNFNSIGLMVDYLCRTGQPPCFLDMPAVNLNASERRDAYTASMERLGHEPYVVPISRSNWNFEELGYEEGVRLISNREFPSGTVLCANDRMAIGLLAAAYSKGLRVGRGSGCAMRIAGHDDHPLARFTCPPLTTVAQDYTAIAERSVESLFALIDGNSGAAVPAIQKLEARLIIRDSA
ncbi:LacI family transcriptional regulator [Marivivens donghaensis]|uniref:LacI family transcriptional regulator n=1 Tax=Marivivens donghaensis TaxID=1699413 RepID=A0ABX0W1Y5_9RHOB|nr:LacI family DNA-binding transcriptional regulator [Marivivens donghaensis]NIY73427.1 LacI family transcriptional regulator [Marivivens donghaensis]